jgi:DNA-binding beta-propeller fold protein YncE
VIDTSTNTVVTTIPVGSRPREVEITPDGKFAWVANDYSGSVSIIDIAVISLSTRLVDFPARWGSLSHPMGDSLM